MSSQAITDLLNKQKIVENMLHKQPMPRHNLVETVLQKQHSAELEQLLARLPASEIGMVLEDLPLEDARLLWRHVAEPQEDDILWELSDDLREFLVGSREPHNEKGHMHAFELSGGRLRQIVITRRQDLVDISPIWIDLLESTKTERAYIGKHYGLDIPDPDDLTDLEASARFYVDDNDDLHLHSDFLLDREGQSRSITVAFIVHKEILFTVRNEELPVFRLQRLRARNQPGYVSDCKDLLLDLYAADVEYSADSLEDVYATLGKVGRKVLSETITDDEAAAILADIAEEEDLNGRIRRNILDTQRAVSFLMRGKILTTSQLDESRQIVRDIESLNSHTSFLFDKINFLMDATVGFININQNQVVKQLTVLSVVFMPLNILAGIGGMSEFSMMTSNTAWPISYGMFTIGLAGVAWLTFLILRYYEKRRLKMKIAASHSSEVAQ